MVATSQAGDDGNNENGGNSGDPSEVDVIACNEGGERRKIARTEVAAGGEDGADGQESIRGADFRGWQELDNMELRLEPRPMARGSAVW